jgi:glycosyltransferase involved in cell wall biosynthesis
MASGLPAVVVNQGGVTDLVIDGVTGYVCPVDPRAFAESVARLRDDPVLRSQMSERARGLAERHPWTAIMAQLEAYYQEALDLNRRSGRTAVQLSALRRSLTTLLQRDQQTV